MKNLRCPVEELLTPEECQTYAVNGLQVVFTSDPWDIATMSMRGIESCQSWDGGFKKRLIGSISDPCCAIIYLTRTNSAACYEDMLMRSVVRLTVHKKKMYLFIDRSYYNDYNRLFLAHSSTFSLILIRLCEKLGLKIPVMTNQDQGFGQINWGNKYRIFRKVNSYGSIPKAKILDKVPSENLSYRDTKIKYRKMKSLPKEMAESKLF